MTRVGQNRSMPAAQLPVDHACLIVHGTDSPGIVAAVSALITRQGANIVQFDQYSDNPASGAYFQRVVFHRPGLREAMPAIEADLDQTLGISGESITPLRSIKKSGTMPFTSSVTKT